MYIIYSLSLSFFFFFFLVDFMVMQLQFYIALNPNLQLQLECLIRVSHLLITRLLFADERLNFLVAIQIFSNEVSRF